MKYVITEEECRDDDGKTAEEAWNKFVKDHPKDIRVISLNKNKKLKKMYMKYLDLQSVVIKITREIGKIDFELAFSIRTGNQNRVPELGGLLEKLGMMPQSNEKSKNSKKTRYIG